MGEEGQRCAALVTAQRFSYNFYLAQVQELIVIESDSSRNFGGDLGVLAYNYEGFVMNLNYL